MARKLTQPNPGASRRRWWAGGAPAKGWIIRAGRALAGVFLLTAATLPAAALSLTTDVTPRSIRVGESARLEIRIEGPSMPQAEPPRMPRIDGLTFRYAGPASQVRIINGQVAQSLSFNYYVTAQKEGDYTLGPFEVVVDGRTLRAPATALRVRAAGDTNGAAAPAGGRRWAFLTLETPLKEAYVGQRVPVEISLYIVAGQNYAPKPLNNPGFVFGGMEPLGQTQVVLDGARYTVVRHQQNAFPTRTGELTLGPAEADVTLRIPQQRRRRAIDPFFDDFFNFSPFGGMDELRPVTLRSDPLTLRVKPLPQAGRPSDFSGAVGRFDMDVTVAPTNVAVGEPIHLKIRIEGEGSLENVNIPLPEEVPGFKVYPGQSQVEVTDQLRMRGVRTIERDLVPLEVSVDRVPGVRFSYFDPDAGAYRTIEHPPTPVLVRPAAREQALAPVVISRDEEGRPTTHERELAPLKEQLGELAIVGPALLRRPWFPALVLTPLAAWAAAWGWRRRQDRLAADPALARRLAFAKARGRRLRELRRLAAAGDRAAFFACAFRCLQEHLAERLDLPAHGLTEAVVDEKLAPMGAPADLLEALRHWFRLCDQARYAPASVEGNLDEMARSLETVLDRVRKLGR
ncbi:MAG: protein BatD [Verrucomicrobia bacterium]|nr:MAG: protein BatD [Verrucomicrobiota bacterium]